MTAANLVSYVRGGQLSVQNIAAMLLARIDETSSINAFIALDKKLVETRARVLDARYKGGEHLPLHGLPLIVKDNIDVEGYATTCGTPSLVNHRPRRSADAVQRLTDAGAWVLGKANLHELAGGVTSNNEHFGAVLNPYDQRMIAGGSSGGTAAAIAAREVPAGLATDTGGSARIPAALCGVCGFRPSTGRYPDDGVLILSRTRDTIGLMARTVEDIQLLDRALTGSWASDGPESMELRVGVARIPFFQDLEDSVASAVEDTLRTLTANGVRIVERDLGEIVPLHAACGDEIVMAEVRDGLEKYLRERGTGLEPHELIRKIATPTLRGRLAGLIELDHAYAERYQYLTDVARPALQRAYEAYFAANQVDVLCYPTTPLTARPVGEDDEVILNGRKVSTFRAYSRNTDSGANAGLPSLSIPLGIANSGLPIGLSIEGARGADAIVLQIGRKIQQLLPSMPPPT